MKTSQESPLLEFVHLILILLAYTSPFWLDWRVIVVAVGVLIGQYLVFKNCIINIKQYGTADETFYSRNFRRLGIPHDPTVVKLVFRWGMMVVIPLVALWYQLIAHGAVLISW